MVARLVATSVFPSPCEALVTMIVFGRHGRFGRFNVSSCVRSLRNCSDTTEPGSRYATSFSSKSGNTTSSSGGREIRTAGRAGSGLRSAASGAPAPSGARVETGAETAAYCGSRA